MAFPTELFIDNDAYFEVGDLSFLDTADGQEKPQSGWTDLKVSVRTTGLETAVPIHVSLEAAMIEQGTTATYRAVLDGSALTTHLAALADTKVFIHFQRLQDYHVVKEVTVRRTRPK